MLARYSKNLYIYVMDRDFGFAPNPFHGYCTLATCKPVIRRNAQIGDWVMGVGGSRLKATGKCIYLMNITEILNFEKYWLDTRFILKRPLRNGSPVMMVGDNIYHKDETTGEWIQEDSHHSNQDGSMNLQNLKIDTKSDNVLISNRFFYFGSSALSIDLKSIGYVNGIGQSKKSFEDVEIFLKRIADNNQKNMNIIIADPFDFEYASMRADQKARRIL